VKDALTQRVLGWTPFYVFADVTSVIASFIAAFVLSQDLESYPAGLAFLPHRKECIILLLGTGAIVLHTFIWLQEGCYMNKLLSGNSVSLCSGQWLFLSFTLFVYLALWRDYEVSRKVLMIFLVLLPFALHISKLAFTRLLILIGAHLGPRLRVIAVCDEQLEQATKEWFANKNMLGIHLCEVLVAPHFQFSDAVVEDRLAEATARQRANLVIWRLPTDAARTERLCQITEAHGSNLAIDLHPILGSMGGIQLAEYAMMKLVSLQKQPLISPSYRFLKRALDIVISLPIVLVVVPVLCALVAILHRIFSPGPLFFKQSRSGANGNRFIILKFRTMSVNHGSEAKQARQNDRRVFFGGALLRKLSIDEMPQFINVLLGSMSVVGPRPHMLEHDALFALECHSYHMRHSVKPGLTGLAQIRGHRGPIDDPSELQNRVISDIEYCQNWTLGLDISIIFRTFFHVFSFHSKSC